MTEFPLYGSYLLETFYEGLEDKHNANEIKIGKVIKVERKGINQINRVCVRKLLKAFTTKCFYKKRSIGEHGLIFYRLKPKFPV